MVAGRDLSRNCLLYAPSAGWPASAACIRPTTRDASIYGNKTGIIPDQTGFFRADILRFSPSMRVMVAETAFPRKIPCCEFRPLAASSRFHCRRGGCAFRSTRAAAESPHGTRLIAASIGVFLPAFLALERNARNTSINRLRTLLGVFPKCSSEGLRNSWLQKIRKAVCDQCFSRVVSLLGLHRGLRGDSARVRDIGLADVRPGDVGAAWWALSTRPPRPGSASMPAGVSVRPGGHGSVTVGIRLANGAGVPLSGLRAGSTGPRAGPSLGRIAAVFSGPGIRAAAAACHGCILISFACPVSSLDSCNLRGMVGVASHRGPLCMRGR